MICTFHPTKDTFPAVTKMSYAACVARNIVQSVSFRVKAYLWPCWWEYLTMSHRRQLSNTDRWLAVVCFQGVAMRETAGRLAATNSVTQRLRDRFINIEIVEETRRC